MVLLTQWEHYTQLDPWAAGQLVDGKYVLDGRNALDLDTWRGAGWNIKAMGRP
ncbi:hypothetical protein [Arthrobacter roseus]|uniref:hypothetical protein n=1 Tax=Arthrobacter roseus TaxID=136274 RepID=UPI0019649564|nr:hypothetical protein [Arthrobacter roseus]MBM7849257.1 UDP-glucose 6-dehydrogenase [Arthrobacter roseus]